MYTLSLNEIRNRLGWTLPQKIDHSVSVIDRFLQDNPNAIIAFSGGVDSLVMLHLIRGMDKNRKAIFVNTTNEHSEILRFVKTIENVETVRPSITFNQVVSQYGFPLISKKVSRMIYVLKHPTEKNQNVRNLYLTGIRKDGVITNSFILSKQYYHLLKAPFNITDRCCDLLKKNPMKPFNKEGMFVGISAAESRMRMFAYGKTGCINQSQKKAFPMAIWNKKDVWDFIKQNKISYCSVYDDGEKSTGCAYCAFGLQFDPLRFCRLKRREPKRYYQMMNLKNNGCSYFEAIQWINGIPQKGLFSMDDLL